MITSDAPFERLIGIVERLRKECPWDREQTHASIKHNLIEEAFEVAEAIDALDMEELQFELGDLLLHVVFHSVLAKESRSFSIDDVIEGISEKLIRRHPHVFGTAEIDSRDEVLANWEKIKLAEGRSSMIEGLPASLPALMRAYRLQEKASRTGFDWKDKEQCWKKVNEEIEEFHDAVRHGDSREKCEEELGDVFFSLVNYARLAGLHPEDALQRTNKKFTARFKAIEEELRRQGKDIHSATLEEMDAIWEETKKREH